MHPQYICSHVNVAVVQHHLETNRLTGFNTLKFHCWLNTLLNDFYHLNHWVNFNCDLLLTLAI
ncbi:hypothetical protein KOSB73_10068 [Klebsiella grimontii]|uniref:Uncharacterized protein n=1 Tax=Klebsiella grimontii TaxID=2058152 RepID=A0A285AUX7_9ENTR|nr:hypothetical protein KOSB73_10068 [Klebsiella grimontii]